MSEANIIALADYFASGCKGQQMLGLELEHFVVDAQSLRGIPFEGGVERILQRLVALGGEAVLSQGRVVGVSYDDAAISLEPAAQLEISIRPSRTTAEIARIYADFATRIAPVLREMGYALLCAGYHPVSRAADLPLIPYRRYEFMDAYFAATGSRGKNMMRGSAATQISLDFTSEADFSKKFRVANILGPLFSLACDNAAIFEGKPATMARTYIWNDVDPARCGIVPGATGQNFGFRDYARYVYGVPPVFLGDEYTGTAPASEIFRNRAMTQAEIEHLASMVFTDVRLHPSLEIRMVDSMPIGCALRFADVLREIFYDAARLNVFDKKVAGLDERDIVQAKAALMERGADAVVYGRPAREWLEEIFGGEYEKFEQALREAGTRAV